MKVITSNSLTKYYGKARGIENVNFEVYESDIFGFIGPNGAGKSTTIRTLLNIIFPTGGSAEIFGKDIVKHSLEIRKKVGYVPSEVYYYDYMKASELFAYSAKFYGITNTVRTKEFAQRLELDLNKKIGELSHGNKKKVSIIQALIHEPSLLILDEPTGGLDPLIQTVFFDIIREENSKGTTVFFSSHVLSEVQKLCNRVAIIKDGSIVKTSSISDLIDDSFKNVKIELSSDVPADFTSDIAGIVNKNISGNSISLLYNGDINLLVAKLAKFNLANLNIEEPSLDEIFLHYYK